MAEAAAVETAPKKGRGRLIATIGIAATLLAGGGAAAYFLLAGKPSEAGLEARPAARRAPVFVDLEAFTVNLASRPDSDDGDRFVQIRLVAEVKDNASGETLKNMMPAVRNEVLLLLAGKSASELATREGKEALARDIVAAANKPLSGTAAADGVQAVNFTHFIIQ